jgi:hypothetical protein
VPAKTTGEQLTTALQGLEKLSGSRKTVWGTPIPWQARPVFTQGFQTAPDFGSANRVIICSYRVPNNMSALICGIVLGYQGGGGAALPGQVLYDIEVDNPFAVPTPGFGYTEKDYGLEPFQVGSFVPGDPWPCEFKYDQNQTVFIKAQTVAGVATGPGNFVFGALIGFQWPSMGWER